MSKNIPIKHHYIPQFILRHFHGDDGKGKLLYFDKASRKLDRKLPEEIFMKKNLYRDEKNYPEQPTEIEGNLAVFEAKVGNIIKKFRKEKEPVLTAGEVESLKLFFAIMGFRSDRTAEMFAEMAKKGGDAMYAHYQKDGDMTTLWKRNLGFLAKCENLQEVSEHPDIDKPIKFFMERDAYGLFVGYFVLIERCNAEDFILGDCYPVEVRGDFVPGLGLPLYSIFPISSERVLLLVANGAEAAPYSVSKLGRDFFRKPKIYGEDCLKFKVKKAYTAEVDFLNDLIFKNSTEGVIIQSEAMLETLLKRQRGREL